MAEDKSKMSDLLGGVKPLKQDKVAPYRKPVDATPKQRLLDEQRVIDELLEASDETHSFESGDELKYIKDGHPPRLLKRLRRGDFSIQEELDLHGLNAMQAKLETHAFINQCAAYDVRAIRIIHGKGNNSAGRVPVIKQLLLGWLHKNQYVLAVCSAPATDGGTGAVYVLLDKA